MSHLMVLAGAKGYWGRCRARIVSVKNTQHFLCPSISVPREECFICLVDSTVKELLIPVGLGKCPAWLVFNSPAVFSGAPWE